ncbi:MAG: MFS transporter [Azospirillum sp.]|nr:MFS transporter [Azospirillum sp.]
MTTPATTIPATTQTPTLPPAAAAGADDLARRSLARRSRYFQVTFFVVVVALLLAAAAAAAYTMLAPFDRELTPALEEKAEALGRSIAGQLGRLLEAGNPLDRLEGMTPFLADAIQDKPDILYVEIGIAEGRPLYRVGQVAEAGIDRVRVPIMVAGTTAAQVELGIDPAYLTTQKLAVGVDLLIVLLVAAIAAFELLLLAGTLLLVRPLGTIDAVLEQAAQGDLSFRLPMFPQGGGRRVAKAWNTLVRSLAETWQSLRIEAAMVRRTLGDDAAARLDVRLTAVTAAARLGDPDQPKTFNRLFLHAVRAPVFLFMLAEEMSRSFLPLYVRSLYRPVEGWSDSFVIGLPITLFMLAIVVTTPIAGRLADRYGLRRVFILGVAPLVIGYLGTALASGFWDLLVWRMFSGVGYAALYIAGQGYIADSSEPGKRTRSMALFMGAVFAAVVAGPALGGILADQIGPRGTFAVSAASALASLMLMLWLLADQPRERPAEISPRLRLRDVAGLLANPGFAGLTFLAAVPGKIALAGFLFYLAPLYLAKLGSSSSETGRILMVYGAATLLLTPLVAQLSDRLRMPAVLVACGGLISGLGMLAVQLRADSGGVLLAVLFLGIGHAASIAPQLALVPGLCRTQISALGTTTVLAVYRLIERMGSVIGPMLAAALVDAWGFRGAVTGIGVLTATSAMVFAILVLGPIGLNRKAGGSP